MDLGKKLIPVFFVLIICANYFNFIGFWLMIRNLPAIKGRSLRKRTKIYFWSMNLLYTLVVVMALIPNYRPLCQHKKHYPHVMQWASCLFLINYCFHWVIFCRKEWFLRPIEEAHSDEVNELKLG